MVVFFWLFNALDIDVQKSLSTSILTSALLHVLKFTNRLEGKVRDLRVITISKIETATIQVVA